jgi:hypothetical protein
MKPMTKLKNYSLNEYENEFVLIDELVPDKQLLRLIDKYLLNAASLNIKKIATHLAK